MPKRINSKEFPCLFTVTVFQRGGLTPVLAPLYFRFMNLFFHVFLRNQYYLLKIIKNNKIKGFPHYYFSLLHTLCSFPFVLMFLSLIYLLLANSKNHCLLLMVYIFNTDLCIVNAAAAFKDMNIHMQLWNLKEINVV